MASEMVLAVYRDGQMTGITTAAASDSVKTLSAAVTEGETVRAYLLDAQYAPLCMPGQLAG